MDLWFGDSWCIGSELARIKGRYDGPNKDFFNAGSRVCWEKSRPDLAFPTMISKDYLNLAGNGAGFEESLFYLQMFLSGEYGNKKAKRAFFALSHPNRRWLAPDNGHLEQLQREWMSDNSDLKRLHYISVNNVNSLYLSCKQHDIEPYFFPIWYPVEFGIWQKLCLVPKENWLIPNTRTIVQEAWNVPYAQQKWWHRKEEEFFKNFISPCENHPNLEGHRVIAECLNDIIKSRGI